MLLKGPANCDWCNRFDHYYVKRFNLKENMKQPLKVYLAGGFHTNWQDLVEAVLEERAPGCFIIMNPKKDWGDTPSTPEEQKEASDKTLTHSPWWPPDKFAIEKADVVFFNVEDYGSPEKMRGTGDIFEAGIAYALGKLVVFVNQVDHRYYRQFERLFQINAKTLDMGIQKLLRLRWLAGRD